MTKERADEIERKVMINLSPIKYVLEDCNNTHVILGVGKYLGMMQKTLQDELEKETNNE